MIDVVDFRRCIERARALLNLHDAPHTLTYSHAIDKDIRVLYTSKYDLLHWLDRWTPERAERLLQNDLKGLRESESDLADYMFKVYNNFARTISTTRDWYRSKGAIYETILDYRYLHQLLPENFTMIDFGPGCARHALAFGYMQNQGLYIGIDCTEVLYILQNAIISFVFPGKMLEYLDFFLEGLKFPTFSEMASGSFIHIPSWEYDKLEPNSVDVLIACHVLDELPRGDFDRLLDIINTCIKKDGIIYARGTIQNPSKMKFPSYHGYDIVSKFEEIGFKEIINNYYPSEGYNVIVWKRKGYGMAKKVLATA